MKKLINILALILPFSIIAILFLFFAWGPFNNIFVKSKIDSIKAVNTSVLYNSVENLFSDLSEISESTNSYINMYNSLQSLKVFETEKIAFKAFPKFVAFASVVGSKFDIEKIYQNEAQLGIDVEFSAFLSKEIQRFLNENIGKDNKYLIDNFKYKNQSIIGIASRSESEKINFAFIRLPEVFNSLKRDEKNSLKRKTDEISRIIVFAQNGDILFHSVGKFVGTNVKDTNMFAKLPHGKAFEGVSEYINLEDMKVLANFRVVSDVGVTVVAEVLTQKIDTTSDNNQMIVYLLVLISVLLLVLEGLIYLIIHRMSAAELAVKFNEDIVESDNLSNQPEQNSQSKEVNFVQDENMLKEINSLKEEINNLTFEIKTRNSISESLKSKVTELEKDILSNNDIIMRMNFENAFTSALDAELLRTNSKADVIGVCIAKISEIYRDKPVIYYKYDDMLGVASLYSYDNIDNVNESLSVELPTVSSNEEMLNIFTNIQNYPVLKSINKNIFKTEEFIAKALIIDNKPEAIITILNVHPQSDENENLIEVLFEKVKCFYSVRN